MESSTESESDERSEEDVSDRERSESWSGPLAASTLMILGRARSGVVAAGWSSESLRGEAD